MPNYPNSLYAPREKENWPGMVFDANKKAIIFKEDFDAIKNEIIAIEQALGLNLSNIFGNWQSFSWRTLFESLDGLIQSGTGSVDNPGEEIDIISGSTSGNEKILKKYVERKPVSFSWGKNRRFRSTIATDSLTNSEAWTISGNKGNARHIGFKIVNGTLYGTVANGTTESTLNCGTISVDTDYKIEVIFTTGSKAEFYVDGDLKGEITTNLPAGTTNANYLFLASIKTTENEMKMLFLSSFEMEQKL